MAHRIVSLLPAATEIACALGFRDRLVGRSHECDHPPGVEALPACTRVRIEDGSSREIDDRVRELLGRGLSLYAIDAERLRALAPTLVLTQDQCAACAATPADLRAALGAWTGVEPEIVSLRPSTLADVWSDVQQVARVLGVPERARRWQAEASERLSAVAERAGGAGSRPSVACLEWLDPPMGAGHWMPELVTLAGGRPLFGAVGARSETLDWEALRAADPDVILVAPCGFDLARTRREIAALTGRPGFAGLRAVRTRRVALADGNAWFNRPGPRLLDSLEALAEILHPERFGSAHRGHGWEWLDDGPSARPA